MFKFSSKYRETLFLELGTHTSKGLVEKNDFKLAQRTLLKQELIEKLETVKNQKVKKFPFRNSMIHDFYSASEYFSYFFSQFSGSFNSLTKFFGVDIYITIHSNISEVAISALEDILRKQNVNNVYFFNEGVASLYGSGLAVDATNKTYLICNIGYSTTDLVLVDRNSIKSDFTFFFGMQSIIEELKKHFKGVYLIDTFDQEIEDIIKQIDLGKKYGARDSFVINGKNTQLGSPITLKITKSEVQNIIVESFNFLIIQINNLLREVPGENLKQFFTDGLVISGGTSLIRGLKWLLDSNIGISKTFCQTYPYTVVNGLREIKEQNLTKYFEIKDFLLY
ncbi:MAG: rod shape-determining protein [Candidatus Dojkabacteria bacterium]